MEKFKIVELFSGIGSQARALKNVGIKIDVQATCEWDIHAFIAYDTIHHKHTKKVSKEILNMDKEALFNELKEYTLSNNGKEAMTEATLHSYNEEILRRMLLAIKRTKNFVDINKIKGKNMPNNTDLLTYSFPCQDLSNVGAFHGYNKGIDKESGSRSSLLWQVGRILLEMKDIGKKLPRYLVMENVPTLLSNRHKDNFEEWINELKILGYESKYILVNAKNYGIPQNRPRILMMSVFVEGNEALKTEVLNLFNRWGDDESYIVEKYKESKYFNELEICNLLRIGKKRNSKLWKESLECTPNDTPSRRKIWNENPKILDGNGNFTNEEYIRTITTKQDRHPNSGNIYFNCGINGKGSFRYLTPRECLLFMGFTDKDYEKLQKYNPMQRGRTKLFPRDKIIRMAGNSIPVKMLEGFFYQLYDFEQIVRNFENKDITRQLPK